MDSLPYFVGVDLVDGTPIIDIKPYLPPYDIIEGATYPSWIENAPIKVAFFS
jgi:tRNA (Thr-GGU) A37 N-methylase